MKHGPIEIRCHQWVESNKAYCGAEAFNFISSMCKSGDGVKRVALTRAELWDKLASCEIIFSKRLEITDYIFGKENLP